MCHVQIIAQGEIDPAIATMEKAEEIKKDINNLFPGINIKVEFSTETKTNEE